MKKKIMLVSSAGGHFAQLKQLQQIFDQRDYYIVTEKNESNGEDKNIKYFFKQQDRKDNHFVLIFIYNLLISLMILIKERPSFIISTGSGAVLPICVLGKLFHSKVIFIESFAKINSPTLTGRIIYKFADRFYIQWEELYEFYPNAIYKGTIY